jgi:site-specific DNA recombinase
MIALYCRVSTEEQVKAGYSLRNQIEKCREKANTNEVMEYVDDGYSGEFLERPGLSKLREDVKNGHITKVICYDPDRLSRKLMNALIIDDEFRSKGVDVIYINGEYENSPEGKLFYSLRGAIAEFEKAKINERMTSGRKRKAQEGKVVKNSGLYGYNYDKPQGMYVINEKEASIVRYIFDQFTHKQKGMNSIAKSLTDKGIKTKTGKDIWHRQVVRQILMNEAYTGRYYQNRWNTEGMLKNRYTTNPEDKISISVRDESEWIQVDIPRIISDEQYNQAAELLKISRRRFAKESKHNYLLSGLLRCQKCGNTMVGIKSKWWGEEVFMYSDRKNTAGAKNKGCGLQIRTNILDEVVWNEIQPLLDNPDKINELSDTKDVSNEMIQIEHLKKEIEKAQKGREKLYSLFAIEDLNVEEIKGQIVEFQKREDKFTKELKRLENYVKSINKKVDTNHFQEIMKDYINKEHYTFDDKRYIIRSIVKQITVIDKDNIRIEVI